MVAKFNRSYMYYRVRNLYDLRVSIHQCRPPIIVVPIHQGWRTANNGVIQIPSSFPIPTQYHAIVAEGYDDSSQQIAFLNSWGPGWGNSGRGFLPYRYFTDFATDAWAVVIAPNLMRDSKKYLSHEFVTHPGAIYNPLGNLSFVISVWQPSSHTRVGWCFATIRDGWYEIEDFFIRPQYQSDKRHFISLAAEAFRVPIHNSLPVRLWVSDTDTRSISANFSVVNELIRRFQLRVSPGGVKWAPYKAELAVPLTGLPTGISSAWPSVLDLSRAAVRGRAGPNLSDHHPTLQIVR